MRTNGKKPWNTGIPCWNAKKQYHYSDEQKFEIRAASPPNPNCWVNPATIVDVIPRAFHLIL